MNILDMNLLRDVTVINELGVHARSAAQIAMLAKKAKSAVWLIKDGVKVDAGSIIDILTLGCAKGTEISLLAENPSDEIILEEIVALVERGFGE
jgi:phosphocarrier protein